MRKLIQLVVLGTVGYVAYAAFMWITHTSPSPKEERSFFGGGSWQWTNPNTGRANRVTLRRLFRTAS